ncbi:MAG: hypothetical protein KBA46_06345 [Candidatus Omnitrophica bacterium]|nr:hypothetical protein [Candidatus Omnitrophota bacterium]
MKSKPRFSLDLHNRLQIFTSAKPVIAQGSLRVNKNNELEFTVAELLAWRTLNRVPRRITFKGTWRLNKLNQPEYVLTRTSRQTEGDVLTIQGNLLAAEKNTCLFQVTTIDKRGSTRFQILKVSGSWQADAYNRLTFLVRKKNDPDVITLEGSWELNQDQQITYAVETTNLKTKSKKVYRIAFEGFWQLDSAQKLTYVLSHASNSFFAFRAHLETNTIYPQDGTIKYRLGFGVSDLNRDDKILTLYGVWKINRLLSLTFEMRYGKSVLKSAEFATHVRFGRSDEVIFSLLDKEREPLGVEVVFTHYFLRRNYAEAFVRLGNYVRDTRIEAGVSVPF